jgi:hypothetical protein
MRKHSCESLHELQIVYVVIQRRPGLRSYPEHRELGA